MFPEPQGQQVGKSMSPYGFLNDTVKTFADIPFLGSLFNIFGKVIFGDLPSKTDYQNVGFGINAWINNAISLGLLQGNLAKAFADGGIVDGGMTRNISGWVEKSLEDLIKNKVTEAINNLKRNLGLEPLQESFPGQKVPDEGGELGSASDAVGGARLFMAAGFPPLAAAILAGNVQAESGWKGQRTPWVLNDGAGTNKGLISWNRSRIVNAEKFLGKPLETASNAEQIKWIKEELKQYGLLDEFMNPQSTEAQLKDASYKYIRWGIEGDRWKYSRQIYAAIERGEQGTYQPPSSQSKGRFSAIEYITGDRSHPNYRADHGGGNYHEHVAFRTSEEKERAKRALIDAGFVTGSEYRPGDSGYHGRGLALDVPFYGQRRRYSDDMAGEKKFSADVRSVLGLKGGGSIKPIKNTKNISSLRTQASYDRKVLAIQPIIIEKPIPMPQQSSSISFIGGGVNSNDNKSLLFVG
jgi:hypothetical protein